MSKTAILSVLRRWHRPFVCLFAALFGYLLFQFGVGVATDNWTVLVIDMEVSAGVGLEAYVNKNSHAPLVEKLVPGQRRQYRLKILTDELRSLRIDPGEVPGAVIHLYGVWLEDRNGSFGHIAAQELVKWDSANMSAMGIVGGAAHFLTQSNDPMLSGAPNTALRVGPPMIDGKRANFLSSPRGLTLLVIQLGVLVLLLAVALNPARRAHLIIVTACVGITVLSLYGFGTYFRALGPIDTSVGKAAFDGKSPAAGSLGILCAVLLCALFAAGYAWYRERRDPLIQTKGPVPFDDRGPQGRVAKCLALIAVPLVLALYFFPAFGLVLPSWMTSQAVPNWDQHNILYWSYLSHIGALPFREFWYPYAGQYSFDWPAPYGLLVHTAYQTAVFSLAYYALYRLSDRNILVALFAVLALVVGGSLEIYQRDVRYLQALIIALIYLAIDRRADRLQSAHFYFWCACCFSLFFEPVQVAYAAPALLAKIVLDAFLDGPFDASAIGRRLARDFTPPALFLIAGLGLYALNGQWANLADFYLGLPDHAVSSAIPGNLVQGATHPSEVEFLILTAPMVMIGIGLFERLRSGRAGSLSGDALLIIGVIAAIFLQKHQFRPIPWQVFVVPAVGLFAYAVTLTRRTVFEAIAAAGLLGVYIAGMGMSGDWEDHWQRLKSGPNRVAAFLLNDALPFDEANAQRFAAHRFNRFTDETAAAARIRAISRPGKPATTYVLTDNQVIYILLDQAPPYHANAYNSSPLYEQKKVLRWLKQYQPRYTVLDRTKLSYDTFQLLVRVPVYYNYVIEHYVPLETVGKIEVLRRRHPDEPVAAGFWRRTLGHTLDFGHLPRASTAEMLIACVNGAAGVACQDFLEISVAPQARRNAHLAIPFAADGHTFTAKLSIVPGESVYHLSLDRIWFWEVFHRNGIETSLDSTALPHGVTVKIVRRAAGREVLY